MVKLILRIDTLNAFFFVLVENGEHCDFTILRNMLIRYIVMYKRCNSYIFAKLTLDQSLDLFGIS